MNILTAINFTSNLIIFSSIFMFLISVFGRSDHPIWKSKTRAIIAKTGLSISCCGAVFNMLTLSTPIPTEIVLNVGLSLNFCWLSWWQYSELKNIKKTSPAKKQTKRTSGRSKKTSLAS